MRQFAAAESRPWATACGARIAHLAAKCCQMLPNAAKMLVNFFLTQFLKKEPLIYKVLPPLFIIINNGNGSYFINLINDI